MQAIAIVSDGREMVKQRTVLVVEDNLFTRKAISLTLQSCNYHVVAAPDGATALALAESSRPDLCLLDLVLPDGNGCDLVPKLRALPGGDRMPIIACSGLVSTFEEARMTSAGFDDIITKPVDTSRLLSAIETLLADAAPSSDGFGEGRKLLLVDDDPVQLKIAVVSLARHGFSTITARDGTEALELARTSFPDAIVSDVLMPRMDGFQLCRAVHSDAALRSIPVLLVTNSYVEARDRDLARSAGAIDLIMRTSDQSSIIDLLRRAFRDGTLVPPPYDVAASPALDEERTRRALRQLEKQVALNAGLTQRGSRLAAEISVLHGISAALAEGAGTDGALETALAACLDAGEVSLGGLFLYGPDGSLDVHAQVGEHPAPRPEALVDDGELERLLVSGQTRACSWEDAGAAKGLAAIGMKSALLVPLQHRTERLGALVLAATGSELFQRERIEFAEAVANQMALAVTLARTFEMLAESERRARADEARLRSILETMPDAVFVVDEEGSITHANKQAEVGSVSAIVMGDGLFLQDQSTPCHAADLPLARALRGEPVHRQELFLRREGTDGRWLSVNALPLRTAAGRVEGAVCAFRDITRERRDQAQLMLSDRLASMGMLAAGVAHEINNPLTAVLTNLDLALEDLEAAQQGREDRRMRTAIEELADARAAGTRVAEIVKDMRMFSGSSDRTMAPVDVQRVLDSSLRMAQNEIRHRARLVKQYSETPKVIANESRLGQAFLNIIVNAVQAIDPGRANDNEIVVRAYTDEQGNATVAVQDTGSGMTPEVLACLFEPFFTTKAREVGTGLGLAITHRIVSSLGGAIDVKSEVGKGSTFRITIPAAPRDTASSAPPDKEKALEPRGGRLLVIDDEPFIGQLAQRVLAPHYEVVFEVDAAQAIARVSSGESFDAVLCDMMMPVMTGMDVHEMLLRIAPDLAERMVLLTGGAFTPETREFLARVSNAKLSKPFSPDELRRAVARALG